MKNEKILIIEDDLGIQEVLEDLLTQEFSLHFSENGIEGITKAKEILPDLILLDLNMPVLDGYQTCKILRENKQFNNVPIIILSASFNSEDRTKAFELGADDYVAKPFNVLELTARMLRKLKTKGINSSLPIEKAIIHLDLKHLSVQVENNKVSLGGIEFKLMQVLLNQFNEIVKREVMLDIVWEKQAVSPRLIDPHILSLRNKIQVLNLTIQTVYGKGYILKKSDA